MEITVKSLGCYQYVTGTEHMSFTQKQLMFMSIHPFAFESGSSSIHTKVYSLTSIQLADVSCMSVSILNVLMRMEK